MKIVVWLTPFFFIFCQWWVSHAQVSSNAPATLSRDLTDGQQALSPKPSFRERHGSVPVEKFLNGKSPETLNPKIREETQRRLDFHLLRESSVLENGTGRGGGVSVTCSQGKSLPNPVFSDLDAVFADRELITGSFDEISERIFSHLERTLPQLAYSYAIFSRAFLNQNPNADSGPSKIIRIWQPDRNLKPLNDEEIDEAEGSRFLSLRKKLQCPAGHEPQLLPAVERAGLPHRNRIQVIQYKYNPNIIGFYRKSKPLHLSFLLVHEWLRDFIRSAKVIRNVNAYFHSKEFLTHSAEQIRANLVELGYPTDHFLALRADIENHLRNLLQEDLESRVPEIYSLAIELKSEGKKKYLANRLTPGCFKEYMNSLRILSPACTDQIMMELNNTKNCHFEILRKVPLQEMFEYASDAESERAEEVFAERTDSGLFDVTLAFCPGWEHQTRRPD